MKSYFLIAALLCLLGAGCRREDIRDVTLKTPGVFNAACAERVIKGVGMLPGVVPEKILVDVEDRTVTVTYDSMIVAHKNIEMAIIDAGFDAGIDIGDETRILPANPNAATNLPPECREGTD